jgi:tetratricopeptide (TPR) repeat protein
MAENKTQIEIEKARAYFYQLKLADCYNILRRYFDRLPFKPEKGHAEFIGMFARVLSELGKKNELNFYMAELEKLEVRMDSPEITYQLAMVYVNSDPPKIKMAASLLEKLITKGDIGEYEAKAKMTLAYCYDSTSKNIEAIRELIFTIGPVEDQSVRNLLETWKAKVYRDEGKFAQSQAILDTLLASLKPDADWYSYFTAKIISIGLYRDWGKEDLARKILLETLSLSKEKPLKTVKRQLEFIQSTFADEKTSSPLVFRIAKNKRVLSFRDQSIEIDESRPIEKLTSLILTQKRLTKEEIIEALFSRNYSELDDSTIYYQIHGVKKFLKKLGLSNPKLEKSGPYYEFKGEVQLLEEHL